MRTILLSLLVFATLLLFTSAAPLDKAIDEFNRILGLDVPKPSKKSLSKKGKPPGKPPGPKLFTEAMSFGFLPQIPTNIIPKIKAVQQNGDQERKDSLFKIYHYFAPLHEKSKKAQFLFQEDLTKDDRTLRSVTENKNTYDTKKTAEKMSAAVH